MRVADSNERGASTVIMDSASTRNVACSTRMPHGKLSLTTAVVRVEEAVLWHYYHCFYLRPSMATQPLTSGSRQ